MDDSKCSIKFKDPVEGYNNKFLLIGFDTKANPIEVMYNRIDEIKLTCFMQCHYDQNMKHC
jgi:hypothetical protein